MIDHVDVIVVEDVPRPWPISWGAAWIGALAGLLATVIFGLVAVGLGAQTAGVEGRLADWDDVGLWSLVFAVFGAFLVGVIGGWSAARSAGIRRAESAILHGVVAWLIGTTLFLFLSALGGGAIGGWAAAFTPALVGVDPATAEAARNGAIAGAFVLLLGLVGSVIGAWLASGEPMRLGGWDRERATARR